MISENGWNANSTKYRSICAGQDEGRLDALNLEHPVRENGAVECGQLYDRCAQEPNSKNPIQNRAPLVSKLKAFH